MEHLAAACSLNADELNEVRARYAEAAGAYTATANVDDRRATVLLYGERAVLHALLDEMIQRESGCCSFLRFEVDETAGGLRVELTAPDAPQPGPLLHEAVGAFFPTARPATPAH